MALDYGGMEEVCRRYGVEPLFPQPSEKLGIAWNVRTGELPIHGLRLRPNGGTCGWYLWAGGEMSEAADFFAPLHLTHVHEWSTLVLPFLGLPPGWRFVIADGYEDVWFDEELLRRDPPAP